MRAASDRMKTPSFCLSCLCQYELSNQLFTARINFVFVCGVSGWSVGWAGGARTGGVGQESPGHQRNRERSSTQCTIYITSSKTRYQMLFCTISFNRFNCFPVWVAAYSLFVLLFGAIKQLQNCCSSGYVSVYPTKQTAIICLQIQQIEFQALCSGPAVVCPLQESFLTAGVSCCCLFQLVGAALVMLYNDIHAVFCMSTTAANRAEWKRQDSQTVAAYVYTVESGPSLQHIISSSDCDCS